MKQHVTDYWLYRQRHLLGYVVALLVIISIVVLAVFFIPQGIHQTEMDAAVQSGNINIRHFDPSSSINLPYHLLQRFFIGVFGVNDLSLKFASILLSLAAIIGMLLLIKEWFRHNVAIISVLIVSTMPIFIYISQAGTAAVMSVTLSIYLLLIGTLITRSKKRVLHWKLLFCALLALNLYVPLGFYLNIAIVSTILFHPHIRYRARKLNPNYIAIGAAVAFILIAPLLYSISINWGIALQLLGIPTSVPPIAESSELLIKSLVWQTGEFNGIFFPVLPLGVLAIMIIGFIRFLSVKYTARSYIIWLWGIVLLPLLTLNPEYVPALIPLVLLMVAMGVNTMISEWYKLFPYNPYARVFGLIPLTIIVVGIVSSGLLRYSSNYYYSPTLVSEFTSDVNLLKKTVDISGATTESPIILLTSTDTVDFYKLMATHDRRFIATSDSDNLPIPYIFSHDAEPAVGRTATPKYIAVNRYSTDSDRFYLYTDESK